MGRRRAVNKVNNQKPSSSSNGNRKRTMDKMDKDNGQKEKKSKKETKTKVPESSINDLPAEMLMKVLKNVDSKSLVGCRLVNKKWNGIASEILQSRPDVELEFNYSNKNGTAKFTYNRRRQDGERSLFDFMECFKNSKNFPFAHFCFSGIDSSSFDNKDWIEFISDFGENIRGLKLAVKSYTLNEEDLIKLTEKVRDLLLIKLPELEKFGLQFRTSRIPNASTIKLFQTSTGNSKLKTTIRLPYLKVLYLNGYTTSKLSGIVTDLLCASVNLQKIEPFSTYGPYFNLADLQQLQSLGKLGCLQAARIEPVGLLSKLSAPLDFKLKSLEIDAEILYETKNLWSDATGFLSNIFESSKDTLRDLNMHFLGFLKDLQLPKFNKLTRLSTCEGGEITYWEDENAESFFPSKINPAEVFPVLHSLELGLPWSTAFPNNGSTACFPTVETLKVKGDGMNGTTISQISLFCPNLKNFEILRGFYSSCKNFPIVGGAIWTHLKKLQSLKVGTYSGYPGAVFPAFDSCITGFSKTDCTRLYKILLADKLWKKCGSEAKIPQSEFEAERKFPSILDLKDLKTFEMEVLCYTQNENLDNIKPRLNKKGPTCVSEKCALDLMDNLVYKIAKKSLFQIQNPNGCS